MPSAPKRGRKIFRMPNRRFLTELRERLRADLALRGSSKVLPTNLAGAGGPGLWQIWVGRRVFRYGDAAAASQAFFNVVAAVLPLGNFVYPTLDSMLSARKPEKNQ